MIVVAVGLIAGAIGLGIGWAVRGAVENPEPIDLDGWGGGAR